MRGMLVHYLIERGFSYEDARAVANAVRASLGKVEFVRKKDMVQLVNKAIRKGFGTHEVGDLIFWERQPTTIIVERKSGVAAFLQGVAVGFHSGVWVAPRPELRDCTDD